MNRHIHKTHVVKRTLSFFERILHLLLYSRFLGRVNQCTYEKIFEIFQNLAENNNCNSIKNIL